MFRQIKLLLVLALIPLVFCDERHRISFEGGYWTLFWEVEDSQIEVEIIGQTTGWVGLGLNTKGKMDLGELIIAGVNDTNGKPYFRTFTGKHHNIKEFKNEVWILNHAEQNETHTTIRAERPLDPEDEDFLNETCPIEEELRLPRSLPINRPSTKKPIVSNGQRYPPTVPILDKKMWLLWAAGKEDKIKKHHGHGTFFVNLVDPDLSLFNRGSSWTKIDMPINFRQINSNEIHKLILNPQLFKKE